MSRFSRVNTIWRKELVDILRDRRTIFAMVLVPIVLYPALLLGSLQAFEAQQSHLQQATYTVIVPSAAVGQWLRRVIDTDVVRRPLEELTGDPPQASPDGDTPRSVAAAAASQPAAPPVAGGTDPAIEGDLAESRAARHVVRHKPPEYVIQVREALPPSLHGELLQAQAAALQPLLPPGPAERVARWLTDALWLQAWKLDLAEPLLSGAVHVAVVTEGDFRSVAQGGSVAVHVMTDQTEIRSNVAASGILGILQRVNDRLVNERLQRVNIPPSYLSPLSITQLSVATPEKVGGSVLGQIVPLILIIMTITGAIYPAIDLTAGERERGTLETLMVAPVATGELISGKFIVVALISLLSAALNLLSIGGTIWLGGLGEILARDKEIIIPLWSLPWVLLALVPLAIMFSAVLLAVCSFARSFKEAQNYVMPVMVAAMIPAVVGILPGTRLEGALLVMPVANIVLLARELFLGRQDLQAIMWVVASTSIYAGAAVAVAAKLFGQEAVLFADSGSIRTIFKRKFFTPRSTPTAASALLLLAILFPLNFFIQRGLLSSELFYRNVNFLYALWAVMIVLFVGVPIFTAKYMRVSEVGALNLRWPHPLAWLAGLLLGCSTWILASGWFWFQQQYILPMSPEMKSLLEAETAWWESVNLWLLVLVIAVTAGFCEEMLFRGYVLSGLRSALGPTASIIIVAIAFGLFHQSAHRLIVTASLGALLAILVVRGGSVWPAVLAHVMHNGLIVAASRSDGIQPLLRGLGFNILPDAPPPAQWLIGAAALAAAALLFCFMIPQRQNPPPRPELTPAAA